MFISSQCHVMMFVYRRDGLAQPHRGHAGSTEDAPPALEVYTGEDPSVEETPQYRCGVSAEGHR